MLIEAQQVKVGNKLNITYENQEHIGIVRKIGLSPFAKIKSVKTNSIMITVKIPTGDIINAEVNKNDQIEILK